MPEAAVCPDLTQYQQLTAGKLADADEEALLEHLERCDPCAQKLNTLAEQDTLVELIRREQAHSDKAADGVIGRLVEHLSKLRPGEASAGAEQAKPPAPLPVPVSPLVFACSGCGKSLKVKAGLAGRKVKCPRCQAVIPVPSTVQLPGEESPRSPALGVGDALTLAPTSPFAGRSSTGTSSNVGVGQSQPVSTNQHLCDFLAPAQSPDELGRLGPYRVLKVLGAGGMGVVFQAEDPHLQRILALKALLPGLAGSDSAKQRFLREARAAAALKHDHIVTIHQVGEDRGAPYLAMEFLEGESLDDRVKREGKLPPADVLRIGREMAEGLAAAHERGLIHRDIKPANVWLEGKKGRVKILDFGLARAATGEAHLTQPGAIVGTPAYMAPEQGQGKTIDPRCDLFSLGCVLYRMATGEVPFRGTDMISTLMAVATEDPAPPVSLNFELPTELSDFIMQLLAKEPKERPESAQVVAESLERMARDEQSPRTPKAGSRQNKAKVSILGAGRRGRRIAVAALALALLVPLGVWLSGIIVRVESKEGTLVIKTEDPSVVVKVTPEGGATLTYGKDRREIHLKPGKYGIELADAKDGLKLSMTQFTIMSGDNKTVEVMWEKKLVKGKDITPPVTKTEDPAPKIVPPAPSPALEALRRDKIPPEALKLAGGGDPNKAPASLVGVLGEAVPIQTDRISRIAFSGDGRWLASASFDKTVFLRDVSSGRVKRVFQGHTGPVSSVAFSKDGQTLVSASHDSTLKLWPTDKEGEPQTLQPKLGAIWALAASPDGRFLAAGGKDGAIKLWKWGKWDKPLDLPAHPGTVRDLAFSPDGELLATARTGTSAGADGHIRLYQTSDGKPAQAWVADKQKYSIHALAFHPNGKWLASASHDRHVKLWEVASGKLLGEHGDWTTWSTLAIHPNGKTLYACLAATNGILFDLPAMKGSDWAGRKTGFFEDGVVCSAFSPDGKFLAAGNVTGVVHVWDATKWEKRLPKQGHSHYVTALAVNLDGRTVLSAGDDNALRRWDVGQPMESQLLHWFDRTLGEVASSPDGKKYVTTAGWVYFDADQRGCVWDAATGKQLFKLAPPAGGSYAAVFSPDNKLLAGISHHSPCLHLWDANNGKELHRFPKNSAGLSAFSADGKMLAAATGKLVKVWDVASGAELHSREDDMPMAAFTLSPDGQRFATGHADGTISFWNLAAKDRKKRTLAGHTAKVNVLRFTPDGETLISSSDDGTIRVWNPERERSLRELIQLGLAKYPSEYYAGLGPHGQSPNRRLVIELDPSGKYLFAAGASPLIYVLRLPNGDQPGSAEKTPATGQ